MIRITPVLQYTGAPKELRKAMPDVLRAVMQGMGQDWFEHYLPGHFEESAYSRYGGMIERRSTAYERRKRKQKGHNRPMVWTGTMRDAVLARGVIRSTPDRVRIEMQGVRALNLSKHRIGYPDFSAELTAVNGDEAQRLAENVDASIQRRLDAIRTVTQFRPGGAGLLPEAAG